MTPRKYINSTLAAALVSLGFVPTVAAQGGVESGRVSVAYAPSQTYGALASAIRATGVFEGFAGVVSSTLALPADLPVVFAECGNANAYYERDHLQVTMCYELVDLVATNLSAFEENPEAILEGAVGVTAGIFLHEIGHALVHFLDIPITGREEDSVDALSTLILLDSGAQEALGATLANLGSMAAMSEAGGELPFWDEHSMWSQRYYDTACLLFGSDPDTYAGLVGPEMLPAERAVRCPNEYEQKSRAWSQLLAPYYRNTSQVEPEATPGSFALTCIGTETGAEVYLQYRWGEDAPWTDGVVKPGNWLVLSYNYDRPGENRSPRLQITYDDDLTDSENWVITDLQSFAASEMQCEEQGWTYSFYVDGWELFVRDDESS